MSSRNILCLALCAVCLLTSLPVVSTAAEVNKNLASNPAAALDEIDSMNLPLMPEDLASELRGTGFLDVLKLVWNKSAPVRLLWSSYQTYSLAGWELGRIMAVNQGLPDPGPKPNLTLLQRAIYWVGSRL